MKSDQSRPDFLVHGHSIRAGTSWGLRDLFLAIVLLTINQIEKNRVRIDLTNKKPILKPKICQKTLQTCPKITSRFTM